ncbi:peptidoglycan DD-metalloendopeptidase family protein [Oscillatoria sp. CS-180]|uniref:M23 family metallopeptidase n=1 Tax=Oscillatoria sp. CS-180 TaxID=3021720 RepID=UPI00232DB5B0|nr:peptidoglycan DD-metalloendopeptidase family protein [Oscillatoria sp. CS-180]MDB9528343.1 peptidoglycan DD-metalloendopeptidase family protein [Oscillatoria sp. CS-180]
MKPESFSSTNRSSRSDRRLMQLLLLGGVGLTGSASVLAALPAQAQTEVDIEAPAAVETSPPLAPVETTAEALLKPQVTATPVIEPTAPAPAFKASPSPAEANAEASSEPAAAPSVELAPAESTIPAPSVSVELETRESYNGSFIDPTDYSLGATASPDRPSLVFTDRSTGCQFTLPEGQFSPSRVCGGNALTAEQVANGEHLVGAAEGTNENVAYSQGSGFSAGPINIGSSGVTFGNTTVVSREYFNERLRPLNMLRRGMEEFVFPLAVPSPITSLFGWRTHPIFGDRRFHTGTDLGAPEGTPVVATKDGEVHVADYLGGYGLTVILRHDDGSLETRYAHLSRLLVRPGEIVQQGDVIGLVGSTGNSTGPHLHFELRELTAQGWVILNPDQLLGYTAGSLVNVLNNPLQAFGLEASDKEKDGTKIPGKKQFELPYRPAQPNAN